MSDRGMKKWAPYKSLIEHDPAINKMKKDNEKISKPRLSGDEAEEINEILQNYSGETLLITVFKNGELIKIETEIKKIDPYEHKLILPNRKSIYLKDVVGLERI